MQYKVILLPVLVLLCNSTVANAQKKGSKIRVYYSAAPTHSKDTFRVAPPTVAKTITRSATPLLADNIVTSEKPAAPLEYAPVVPTPPAPPPPVNNVIEPAVVAEVEQPEKDTSIKPKYGPVPLAGTKSYFGEKNTYVNDYVRHYLEVHNRTLTSVQSSSTKPFNVIDDVLEKKQLPKELKYLAVIESALNHKAVSRAGAVGPWQLMESTARMMGLTVNRKTDDRTDWYKSTAAATKYLELLYSQLNDWLLVIAAYNSGPVPVQRAIDRTGSHNFWDIKEFLPRETQGHVLAFIATASIFENLSKFINLGSIPVDFKFGKDEAPLLLAKKELLTAKTETPAAAGTTVVAAKTISPKSPYTDDELKHMAIVRITDPIHLGLMAQELGIDKKLLTRWNGDYDMFVMKNYPTPFYNLRLPKDKLDAFLSKKDKLTHKSEGIFSQIGKQ